MGVCETKKTTIPEKIPKLKTEDLSINEIKYFEYECPINITQLEKYQKGSQLQSNNQIQNNQNNQNTQQVHQIHLQFVLSNIKIHQCFSRSKTNQKSLFIYELKLGKKIFPLSFNYGEYPVIYGQFEEKMSFISLAELNKYYFIINIYEVISEFDDDKIRSFKENPNNLKTYKGYSKHCSYFQMDLLSLVYRSNKFDFALLGKRPISSSARISFQLDMEQLCSFIITIKNKDEQDNIDNNGEFILNYKLFNSKVNYDENKKAYYRCAGC